MGKKKRQKAPNEINSSEEEDEEIFSGVSCPHVAKAVSLPSIKKMLKNTLQLGNCTQCEKNNKNSDEGEDTAEPNVVWMCLQCGNQGCGRYSNDQHALQHYKSPRSLSHALNVSIDKWSVWCYDCDNEVSLNSNKRLQESIDFIKRHFLKETKDIEKEKASPEPELKPACIIEKEDSQKTDKIVPVGCHVRGLRNLGNTCFFNSVMQNISQTNCLWNSLQTNVNPNSEMVLDGCNIKVCEEQVHLDPINIVLLDPGAMTKSVDYFFTEMRSSKTSSVDPKILFGHIRDKAPQFKDFHQQDSHELLRVLLDGIRSEEIRRIKAAILNKFNINGKASVDKLDEEIKLKIKAYGRSGSQTIIDQIFGGLLISTVVCEECHMSSQVFEPFLDLSLPVSEEKQLRVTNQKKQETELKKDDFDSSTVSKYQEKKLKRQSKKDAKRKAKQEKLNSKTINLGDTQESVDEQPNTSVKTESLSDISDADIEDNVDTSSNMSENKLEDSTECMDDFVVLNHNLEAADVDNLSSKVQGMRIRRKSQSTDSFLAENAVAMDESFEVIDSSAVEDNKQKETDTKEEWKARSLNSLGPRYQCLSHECSIQSCLNQFTSAELLTGPNKFGCENCTKLKADKNKDGEKVPTVYSIANKQILLFSPPAILTLHLKRFQQVGFSLKKINRHVDFPMLLDLAPFCSSICLGLPTLHNSQKNVLYSLYGVVEHSGRLSGGHYTAYVRVQENNDAFKNFLNTKASGQYEIDSLVKEMAKKCEPAQSTPPLDDIKASQGKWFHISDSFSKEVSSETVLKAQAYLLFYERVF